MMINLTPLNNDLKEKQINLKKLDEAILAIDQVRDSHGKVYGSPGSESVAKSRELRGVAYLKYWGRDLGRVTVE